MYDTGCFPSNAFYPPTSSCSSTTSSPDSLKHQRLLITATPSPPTVSQPYFATPTQPAFLFDQHRFHLNPNKNNNNNNNNNHHHTNPINNSNLNGNSDLHGSLLTNPSNQDQLSLWLAAQSTPATATVQSPQSRSHALVSPTVGRERACMS